MRGQPKGAAKTRERTSALDGRLEKRLATYAAAAGAAGVSMLALASPAKADIVYTAANIRVPQVGGNGEGITIDLNHDGVADFYLWIWSYADFSPTYIDLFLYARNAANGAEGVGPGFAARLVSGASIGSEEKFAPARQLFGLPLADMKVVTSHGFVNEKTFCEGPWVKPNKNGFLGVKFDISGEIHYGWIRLTTGACVGGGRLEARITGYAYNTEGGQPLLAGQGSPEGEAMMEPSDSGTLGRLALGSLGLDFRRPKEQRPHNGN